MAGTKNDEKSCAVQTKKAFTLKIMVGGNFQ